MNFRHREALLRGTVKRVDHCGRRAGGRDQTKEAASFFAGVDKCFMETDASQVEINPLILTGDGRVVARYASTTKPESLAKDIEKLLENK